MTNSLDNYQKLILRNVPFNTVENQVLIKDDSPFVYKDVKHFHPCDIQYDIRVCVRARLECGWYTWKVPLPQSNLSGVLVQLS